MGEYKKITTNMAQCLKCKEVLTSKSTHDFVTCSCGNLSVDGGTSYLKRSFKDMKQWRELSTFEK